MRNTLGGSDTTAIGMNKGLAESAQVKERTCIGPLCKGRKSFMSDSNRNRLCSKCRAKNQTEYSKTVASFREDGRVIRQEVS